MDRRRFLTLTGGAGLGVGLVAATGATPAAAMWFPYFNRRIPDEAHQVMAQLAPQGITSFSFTPANGWVMVTQMGNYFARNIPEECFAKLGEMVAAGIRIHCIAFPPAGGNSWVITGDTGLFARNIPQECYEKILELYATGQQVVHVAFPPAGGNRWVVVGSAGFFARNIDDECFQMMRNLTQGGGRRVTRVAFPYTGGWTVVAQDEFFARNIDPECFQMMQSFASGGWELHNVVFSPMNNGWSLSSRGLVAPMPPDPARRVEAMVGGMGIWQRMAWWGTPGAAVAVVQGNQVAWSTGYGWLEAGQPHAAHPESAFQAASVSKAVASVGVMRLLQTQALPLDADIRPTLNWPLGARWCVAPAAVPTIDQVLAHRGGVIGRGSTTPANVCAGFDPGGGGFSGYGPLDPVPTLLQVMNGQGNSPRVELTTNPGAEFHYSGGGFVLLQRMVEERTGLTLAQYMQNEIFGPLGMATSSYELDPLFELASGHTAAGAVIPGRRYRYPESAAAGLYTTVRDLCQLVAYLNQAWMAPGDIPGPLSRDSVRTMLNTGPTPDMGRGFFLANQGTFNHWYGHSGSNFGFKSEFGGYPQRGMGYAVLVNGDRGELVSEIVAAIKAVYGLP
ncbi:MAG TPA: serine hydrolase domain-containing protein [Micromonosporaceae bacterium]|nr:serine hydrolase domain-containing protein [Micromonosporaceae bacterium]